MVPPAMERREPNHVAQKTAILGLLDCHIRVADGRDSVPSIPYPGFIARTYIFVLFQWGLSWNI